MSYTIVLQDWVRIAGGAGAVVLQAENEMPDISLFQDITFYTEVTDLSGATLKVQTAPLKEEAYFGDLQTVSATGLAVLKVRWETATTPPARWLRWRANGAAAWNVTFRITASLNPGGSIPRPFNGMAAPGMSGGMAPPPRR
jgi:hypothetical protein